MDRLVIEVRDGPDGPGLVCRARDKEDLIFQSEHLKAGRYNLGLVVSEAFGCSIVLATDGVLIVGDPGYASIESPSGTHRLY